MSSESMLNLSNFGLRFPGLTGFGSKHLPHRIMMTQNNNKNYHNSTIALINHKNSNYTSHHTPSTRLDKPLSVSSASSSFHHLLTAVSHAPHVIHQSATADSAATATSASSFPDSSSVSCFIENPSAISSASLILHPLTTPSTFLDSIKSSPVPPVISITSCHDDTSTAALSTAEPLVMTAATVDSSDYASAAASPVTQSLSSTFNPCNIRNAPPIIPPSVFSLKKRAKTPLVRIFSLKNAHKKCTSASLTPATNSHSHPKNSIMNLSDKKERIRSNNSRSATEAVLRKVHSNDNRCLKLMNRKNNIHHKKDPITSSSTNHFERGSIFKIDKKVLHMNDDAESTIPNETEVASVELISGQKEEEEADSRKGYLTLSQFRQKMADRLQKGSERINDSNSSVILKSYVQKSFCVKPQMINGTSSSHLMMSALEKPDDLAKTSRSRFTGVKTVARSVISCFLDLFAP